MVRKCDCVHKYQDQKYGNGRRVMNKCNAGYRCTVCDKDHRTSSGK